MYVEISGLLQLHLFFPSSLYQNVKTILMCCCRQGAYVNKQRCKAQFTPDTIFSWCVISGWCYKLSHDYIFKKQEASLRVRCFLLVLPLNLIRQPDHKSKTKLKHSHTKQESSPRGYVQLQRTFHPFSQVTTCLLRISSRQLLCII